MNTTKILQELKSERARIDQAISAIESLDHAKPRRGERPKATPPRKRARRRMTAAGRAKLARLMSQRWAARKKAGKTTLG